MVMTSFGKQKFHAANGRLSMYSKCLDFFSIKFWVGGGGIGGGFFSLWGANSGPTRHDSTNNSIILKATLSGGLI
jgi:hypothetical protein